MKLNENLLVSYSRYVEYGDNNSAIGEFKSVLSYGINIIKEHLNLDFNYEINTFGAINLNTLISQYEPISFYIKIFDLKIYENVQKSVNIKSKNKKSKLTTTESIKLLLSIYLEKYFEECNNVSVGRNCLIIESQALYGFNSRIYLFVSNLENCIMIDSSSSKLLEANIEKFENMFLKKAEETDYKIIRVVNIIKNLCAKSSVLQNPFLIETLVYNIPNKYFEGELREQVIKCINYIKFSNISKFKSLLNPNQNLDKDYFVISSIFNVYKSYDLLVKSLR